MKSYESFIYEKKYNDNQLFYQLVDMFYESNLLNSEQKQSLCESLNTYSPSQYLILEKSDFFDTYLKPRWNKAKEVVKNFSNDAKKALELIINAAKTAKEFIEKIAEKINRYASDIMTKTKAKIMEKLKYDNDIIKAIKDTTDKNKEGVVKDLKVSKDVVVFYKNTFLSSFKQKITDAVSSLIVGNKQPVVESLKYMEDFINEEVEMGNNVIQKLIHGIEEIPPFSWLSNLKNSIEKGINDILNVFSFFTEKMGGPKFTLPVIASIIAIAIEYNIKGLAKNGLVDMVIDFSIPFIGTAIKVIGLIATVIACIELIDDLTGSHILGHHTNKEVVKTEKPGVPVPTVQGQTEINNKNTQTTVQGKEPIPAAVKTN